MVRELVTQRALDLAGEQRPIVPKVTFQRIPVDDDPVLVLSASNSVTEILTISSNLMSQVGDNDCHARQYLLEFLWQPIDRVDDQRFELLGLGRVPHISTVETPERLDSNQRPTDYGRKASAAAIPA